MVKFAVNDNSLFDNFIRIWVLSNLNFDSIDQQHKNGENWRCCQSARRKHNQQADISVDVLLNIEDENSKTHQVTDSEIIIVFTAF